MFRLPGTTIVFVHETIRITNMYHRHDYLDSWGGCYKLSDEVDRHFENFQILKTSSVETGFKT